MKRKFLSFIQARRTIRHEFLLMVQGPTVISINIHQGHMHFYTVALNSC